METTILYPNGRRVEAVVLSAGSQSMRLISRELDDAILLSLTDGRWTDESGVAVEFESFINSGKTERLDCRPLWRPFTLSTASALPF